MNWLAEMNRLADEIKELELRVAQAYRAKAEVEKTISLWESKQLSRIAGEVNENTGKAKYPSDSTRKAELERRKSESEDYKQLAEDYQKILDELSVIRIELEHRRELLKNLRTWLRYQAVKADDTTASSGRKLKRRL